MVIFWSVSCERGKWLGLAGQPVEQILGIDGDVSSGAEEAGMAGNTAHAARSWIVDHSPQHDALIVLRGGDTAAPAFRRQELHMLHAQRLGQVSLWY